MNKVLWLLLVAALAAFFLTALWPSSARALQQPSGATIPSPVVECENGHPGGLGAAFACACDQPGVCNIGAPCPGGSPSCDDGQNGTCESTLWHTVNDDACKPSNLSGLDPAAEASTTPETFSPTCPLTFTVLTRGSAMFQDAFGWYNVGTTTPGPDDLFVMLDCHGGAGQAAVLDVKNDPRYRGGEVGFFLLTPESHGTPKSCQGGDCCATVDRLRAGTGHVYFSQRGLNPDSSGASSLIHLLIYDSHISTRKFYFAWEDIFGGSNNNFTDLVTSVAGVECSGAGGACDTGQKGACAAGVTHCENGSLACTALYAPLPEVCDGFDNDCNGNIDDGAPCPDGQSCLNGACLNPCTGNAEFDCPGDTQCNHQSGLCIETSCLGVTCPAEQVCQKGACVGGCEGVVCPHNQLCRLGTCLDPCKDVQCPSGQVCAGGGCVPGCGRCDGLACTGGTLCDMATGACVDPSCPTACPAGTFCRGGSCVDACDGATCPNGNSCHAGQCQVPQATTPDGGADPNLGTVDFGDRQKPPGQRAGGCGCSLGPTPPSGLFPLLLFLGFVVRRKFQ